MDASRITQAWLAVAVALCAAMSCDVEPAELETEDDSPRDEELVDPDEARDQALDVLDEVTEPPEPEPLFPTGNCRAGFVQAGSRLCISQVAQNATRYRSAVRNCRNQRSQVCSYEDLTYLYYSTSLDANYNPNDMWIGNMVGDDSVLCGNRDVTSNSDSDISNFEETCDKNDQRSYWCCHDDE
jgi:hypothetical protein